MTKVHTGQDRWRWELSIQGGVIITDAAIVRASYDKEGKGTMTISTPIDLRHHRRKRISLHCGYGEAGSALTEWWTGQLGRAKYDRATGLYEAEAYGPSGILARRSFGENILYQGDTFSSFFADITSRLLDPRTRIEVTAGQRIAMENTAFNAEVTLGEAAASVIGPGDYVMRDRPGLLLSVRPRPRPNAAGRGAKATYSAPDLPLGEPKQEPAPDGPYHKVIVFRRDEAGADVVNAEARIDNRGLIKPAPNEIYFIPEFQGTQEEAQSVAILTASSLAEEGTIGTLTGVSANERLLQDDPVMIVIDDEYRSAEPTQRYELTYAATITEIELDAIASTTTFAYEALLVDQRRL